MAISKIFAVLVCFAVGQISVLVDGVEGRKLINDACASSCLVSKNRINEVAHRKSEHG